jgi:hypothetical protein
MQSSTQPLTQAFKIAARLDVPVPVLAAVVGYTVTLFSRSLLLDGDTYLHIATGEWILRHGAVPHNDPFSYTFAGAPWVAHEWLSEVLLALAYRLGRWNGVAALSGAAVALTFWLLARHLEWRLNRLPATLILIVGAVCITPSLLARPHLLALPLLELWTAGLLSARAREAVPSPLLLPIMLLWANLHGSFIFGLALILPLALEAVAEAGKSWAPLARGWAVFLAAAVLVSMATPHGWHGLLFPFQLMSMKQLSAIGEWQATNFQKVQPIELALMAILYVALSREVRLPALRVLLLMGLLHLALHHARHQMVAGIVGALLLAEPLGQPLNSGERHSECNEGRGAVIGLVLGLLLSAVRLAYPIVRTDDHATPVSVYNHVPADIVQTPVFNDYAFGGYLIFKGIRPFIDGRADMYGDEFLSTYLTIIKPNQEAFERVVSKYGIRWTILSADSRAVDMLDSLPGWRRLYADSTAVVHVRVEGEQAGKAPSCAPLPP